jgi:hypothetical protein
MFPFKRHGNEGEENFVILLNKKGKKKTSASDKLITQFS